MKNGKVYLIGAGPGDPGLMTLKGIKCIENADVVVYDYLANPELLEYAREGAEFIYVGKKGGDHTFSQTQINAMIMEMAKQGNVIARLKGGDPFIFGRGGEEAEELAAEGIAFEVVPGVTSAVSVPAYSGIPLTHRDFTSDVAFVTGHEDPLKNRSSIAWDKISTGIGTLVFLMGVKNLPNIVENLMKNGRDPKTPVALIRWGTTAKQETLTGDLETIVRLAEKNSFTPPAIAVVGEVVKLRERLSWFETKPLFGKKIIVTRARSQASELSHLLREYGADPIEFPTIEILPPESFDALDEAIDHLERYDWLILTSVNGVKYFLERLRNRERDIRDLKGIKICTIGPRTADELEKLGIMIDFVPEEYRAESIIEGLKERGIRGKKILLPRAEEAREVLPEEIRNSGGRVDVVTAYRTVRPLERRDTVKKLFQEGSIHVITFTSSSTVKNFVEMFEKQEILPLLKKVTTASIGPITAETAASLGIKTHIMPQEYTIPALTEAIVEYFVQKTEV
ncbi:MAG: uroporphyrinogen-III C-methyltransferase [Thermodesulfobacteriota bacterium]|nr:uroporphyrinogen-III C-methyltransferase [Thermodesulfobacteriota bacterium]